MSQQAKHTRKETAYIEGNYDYNIWYDKYLIDRKEEKEKILVEHKCIPSLDTGYTRVDKQEKMDLHIFVFSSLKDVALKVLIVVFIIEFQLLKNVKK